MATLRALETGLLADLKRGPPALERLLLEVHEAYWAAVLSLYNLRHEMPEGGNA